MTMTTTLKQTTMTSKTYTATTSNAYPAKEFLKKAGFEFNTTLKQWISYDFNEQEWKDKYCSASYVGRGNAKLTQAVKFETKKMLVD